MGFKGKHCDPRTMGRGIPGGTTLDRFETRAAVWAVGWVQRTEMIGDRLTKDLSCGDLILGCHGDTACGEDA
jgi:hypothetical protein